jgi:hypothetical protein
MITFFRRIRQSLLSQKRLTQYLLYALGEIVLVVIGILLALQINNWNEERKESKAIKNVLVEIREDLLQDQVEFMRAIALRKDDLDAQKRIIEVLETKGSLNERVLSDLGRINLSRPIYLASKGYDLLKELKLGTLKDKKLRILLTKYYERDIPMVHQEFKDDNFEFEHYWLPYVRRHFKEWEFGQFAIPHDYEQLLDDKSLLTATRMNSNNANNTINAYHTALNTSSALISILPDS